MDRFGLSEKIIASICAVAKNNGVEKVILFGSRAKNTCTERSDIDLAVVGGNEEAFSIDVEYEVPTLLKFDVVRMSKPVQKCLLDEIEKDGIVLYDKDEEI